MDSTTMRSIGITADGHGRLWMACSKGIFSVKRDDLLSFAAGHLQAVRDLAVQPDRCPADDRVPWRRSPALWKMQDGRIWFSTIHGLIVLGPQSFDTAVATGARGDGRDDRQRHAAAARRIGRMLPRGANNISFATRRSAFARRRGSPFAIDWMVLTRIGWKPERGARAFYTNLAAGQLPLSRDGAAISTTVSARRQRRSTSRSDRGFINPAGFCRPVSASLRLAGWFAYRWRIRWIEARLQAIATERSRIARELHDTLMQGFSGVTMEMQALLTRLPPSENRDDAGRDHQRRGHLPPRGAAFDRGSAQHAAGQESGLAAAIAQTAPPTDRND